MAQRILSPAIFIVALLFVGCAPAGNSERAGKPVGQTDFSTDDIPPPPQPDGRRAAPLAFKDEHTVTKLPTYKIPEKIRERLKEVDPSLLVPETKAFDVLNQNLNIKVKSKTLTFTGVLRIPGKQDEALELSCSFNPSDVPWVCTDMFPTDVKRAEERRLQATVKCLDPYSCTTLGLELFVVIDGKTLSKVFQTEPFSIRRAESGDGEDEEAYEPPVTDQQQQPAYKPPVIEESTKDGAYRPPKVLEKPTPAPTQKDQSRIPSEPRPHNHMHKEAEVEPNVPTPVPPSAVEADEEEDVSEEELDEFMNDPNVGVEIRTPMRMPNPTAGKYSIPGIEKLRPQVSGGPQQAIGRHNSGRLIKGKPLPAKGEGYICPRVSKNTHYGTNLLVDMIQKVSASVERLSPGKPPVVVHDLSGPTGGRLSGHRSHQSGLDVDIGFPSEKPTSGFWPACASSRVLSRPASKGRRATYTTRCNKGATIDGAPGLDEARFWNYLKTFTCTDTSAKDGKVVIAIFLDKEIKRHMCQYVRKLGESTEKGSCAYKALQVLKHEGNHHHHIHVRLKCPGNEDCHEATVTLADGTGC
ncbi:MAG: penicillin-insensitive murein endopeptidase [Bdellovibrionales bacterium]|nr:penicillin-insensitive murein endopeptidase [Bdellovibrionales bacterium]